MGQKTGKLRVLGIAGYRLSNIRHRIEFLCSAAGDFVPVLADISSSAEKDSPETTGKEISDRIPPHYPLLFRFFRPPDGQIAPLGEQPFRLPSHRHSAWTENKENLKVFQEFAKWAKGFVSGYFEARYKSFGTLVIIRLQCIGRGCRKLFERFREFFL